MQELEHERIPTRLQAVLHDYPLESPMEGSALLVENPHEDTSTDSRNQFSLDITMIDHGSSAEESGDGDLLTPEDLSAEFEQHRDPRRDKRRTLTLANAYEVQSESIPEIVLQSSRPGSPPQSSTPLYNDHPSPNSIDISPISSPPAHDLSQISLSDFLADQASRSYNQTVDPKAEDSSSIANTLNDDSRQQNSFQTANDTPLVSPTDERSARAGSQAAVDYFGPTSAQEIEVHSDVEQQSEEGEQEPAVQAQIERQGEQVGLDNPGQLDDEAHQEKQFSTLQSEEIASSAAIAIVSGESMHEVKADSAHGKEEEDAGGSKVEEIAEEANTTLSEALPSTVSAPSEPATPPNEASSPIKTDSFPLKAAQTSPTKLPLPATLTPQALQQHNVLSRMQLGRSISLQDMQPRSRRALSYISNGSNESSQSLFSNTLGVRGSLKRSKSSQLGLGLGLDRAGGILGMERPDIARLEDFEEGDSREEEDVD